MAELYRIIDELGVTPDSLTSVTHHLFHQELDDPIQRAQTLSTLYSLLNTTFQDLFTDRAAEQLLISASRYNALDLVSYLVEQRGINIDCTNEEDGIGITPLMVAHLQQDNFELVGWLLDHGAAVNKALACGEPDPRWPRRRAEGLTAVHYAAENRRLKSLRRLLEAGGDANKATVFGGLTPLLAVFQVPARTSKHTLNRASLMEIIDLLLEHGADARATGSDGRNVLHTMPLYARYAGMLFIEDWYAPRETHCRRDEMAGSAHVRKLVEHGADPYLRAEVRNGSSVVPGMLPCQHARDVRVRTSSTAELLEVLEEYTSDYWLVLQEMQRDEMN